MSESQRPSGSSRAPNVTSVDTEQIDSEWPEESPENQELPLAHPTVPKAPALPSGLAATTEKIDSDWPAAMPPEKQPQVKVVAPAAVAPAAVAPAAVAPAAVAPAAAKARSVSRREDLFAEPKSNSSLLIGGLSLGLLALFAVFLWSQSDPSGAEPARQVVVPINPKPASVSVPPTQAPSESKPASDEAPPAAASVVPPVVEASSAARATAGPVGGTAVLIESVPPEARVYWIDGTKWRDKGFTPVTLEVPRGEPMRLVVVKDGFGVRKLTVDGSQTKVSAGLAALSQSPTTATPTPEAPETEK